jgi:uncharacterized protein
MDVASAKVSRLVIAGPAGGLEVAVENSAASVMGVAVIAHPHPLFGGTMDNKVVQTLSRAALQRGWKTVRFNFRGVGASEGVHDGGVGERADMQAVVDAFAEDLPLGLFGFSFGAAVASHVVSRMAAGGQRTASVVLVGTAASRFEVAPIPQDWHDQTLVVHGEVDDTVPLVSVMDWARPQGLPVTVVPGGEHFFHGRLPLLKRVVMRHLASCVADV